MELEESLEEFRAQGLGVAAICYDPQEVLRHFAERMGGFSYPLLSDADSKEIRDFGIFNHNIPEDHEWYGICFPGAYVVDAEGIVRSKHFEEMHRQRLTADKLLVKEFGVGGGKRVEIETDHLKLSAFPSQDEVRPGNRITLVLDIELPPKMHLYAPRVEGYRPVALTLPRHPAVQIHDTEFPPSRELHLEAIRETVPVYEGCTRILQDVTISPVFREPRLEIPATPLLSGVRRPGLLRAGENPADVPLDDLRP